VARHRIRDDLQQMILNGRYKPGSKLVQQDLAKKFGVSQSVVREALLELQVCGLVETVDNRGVFVGQLNMQTLLESFDVREVHEGLVARSCVERVTRADLRVLRELVERMCSLGLAGKLEEMASLDREFHQQLLRLSGNSMLVRLAGNYGILGKVIRVGRNPRVIRREHLAILDAIEADRADQAERLMREHIRAGKKLVEARVKSGKFVPQWVR
jgi:DNA-binding GntR family transcriptional regulator